ncbi:hypothetical protein ACQJBY_036827 [Aegilops geniculata]
MDDIIQQHGCSPSSASTSVDHGFVEVMNRTRRMGTLDLRPFLDSETQKRDVYGTWEQYLGLERTDTAIKGPIQPIRDMHLNISSNYSGGFMYMQNITHMRRQ